jgi:branched-chain amino acid transport system substrate-binding protein
MHRRRLAPIMFLGPIAAAALAAAVGISACGSAQRVKTATSATTGKPTKIVDIYASLPRRGPQGAEGRAIWRGIEVGLNENEPIPGEINGFKVKPVVLNDASNSESWTQKAVERNAERAARDPRAIIYIGDLDSGATEISLPVLNQAGIVQITPGSGYAGLTDAVVGVTKDEEPNKFYPTHIFTLLRLIPDDTVQAAAALSELSAPPISCQRIAAISFDSTLDGPALVGAVKETAKDYNMTYVPAKLASGASTAQATYAEYLKHAATQCLFVAGRPTAEAVSLVRTFHDVLPNDPIVASSGLCNQMFTNPRDGGLPVTLDPFVSCISPVLPIDRYGTRLSAQFITAYHVLFPHQTPGPYTAYGYVAGELAVAAVDALGFGGDNRRAVQTALLGGVAGTGTGDAEHYSDLMGELTFDSHGNLYSPTRIGLFHIEDGVPVLQKVLTPPTKVDGPG